MYRPVCVREAEFTSNTAELGDFAVQYCFQELAQPEPAGWSDLMFSMVLLPLKNE